MSEWITSNQLAQAAPRFLEENSEAKDQWHSISSLMDEVEGDPGAEALLSEQLQDLGGILDRAEQAWNEAGEEDLDSLDEVRNALRELEEVHAALSRMLSEDAQEV